MGEAMRDLLNYTPETPAQLARDELDRALRLVQDLVLSVDLGKNVVFPCREDMVLYYAIKHIERAAKALSEHREALEQALHKRKPWKVKWQALVIVNKLTGEEVVYTEAWKRHVLSEWRSTGQLPKNVRIAYRFLSRSWPQPRPDEIDWTGFDEEPTLPA